MVSEFTPEIEAELAQMNDSQRRIFNAALEEFSAKGYNAASTQEIARQAGVSDSLVFKHFRTKERLFQSVLMPVILHVVIPLAVRRVGGALSADQPDIRSFIEGILRERLDFARSHAKFVRLVLQEVPNNAQLRARILENFQAKGLPALTAALERYRKKGEIGDISADAAFRAIFPLVLGFVIPRAVYNYGDPATEEAELSQTAEFIRKALR